MYDVHENEETPNWSVAFWSHVTHECPELWMQPRVRKKFISVFKVLAVK